jgi:hypothetical protein
MFTFRPDAIQEIVDAVLTEPPIWHEVDDGTYSG